MEEGTEKLALLVLDVYLPTLHDWFIIFSVS